ncbi:MAG: methyltransferase, partial [Flavobacteriaceae bacterium]|nr:methyltransferase [Muriicola sp.]NNK20572.1 methyltransferase [Flavobacteriaceae bacterium]NNL39325.1 methyltransferase [Flavobacteriaceae bacterium]
MKIGTDGVLLGAWTPIVHRPINILDVGAGTGLIALMLAQRSNAETIDAIEIEEAAYEQCVENFEASPWADRLFCYHAGLDEMVEEMEETYELIVSNPPFHVEGTHSGDKSRDLARQNNSLPFDELLSSVDKLLAPEGIFTTIVPFQQEVTFIDLARQANLHIFKITRVKGN